MSNLATAQITAVIRMNPAVPTEAILAMNTALPHLHGRTHFTLLLTAIAMPFLLGGCRFGTSDSDLPMPTMHSADEVQYFPAGPEFKLPPEAVALKQAREEERRLRASGGSATEVDALRAAKDIEPDNGG